MRLGVPEILCVVSHHCSRLSQCRPTFSPSRSLAGRPRKRFASSYRTRKPAGSPRLRLPLALLTAALRRADPATPRRHPPPAFYPLPTIPCPAHHHEKAACQRLLELLLFSIPTMNPTAISRAAQDPLAVLKPQEISAESDASRYTFTGELVSTPAAVFRAKRQSFSICSSVTLFEQSPTAATPSVSSRITSFGPSTTTSPTLCNDSRTCGS